MAYKRGMLVCWLRGEPATALTLLFILFAIPAGLLADRISRRWLMAGSEGLRAAALLGMLLLIWLTMLSGYIGVPIIRESMLESVLLAIAAVPVIVAASVTVTARSPPR